MKDQSLLQGFEPTISDHCLTMMYHYNGSYIQKYFKLNLFFMCCKEQKVHLNQFLFLQMTMASTS
jgi:hypothetical protein